MMTEPSPFVRRARRCFLYAVVGYFFYLPLLGPLVALAGRGYLDCLPTIIGRVLFLPAAPLLLTPGLRELARDYFDWWYHDPADPYSSPDWR